MASNSRSGPPGIVIPDELMKDPSEQWLADLEAQLEALRPAMQLVEQLTALRERLTGTTPTGRRPGPRSTSGASRASGQGTVKDQLVALVQQHPEGLTIPEAAGLMNKAANYLYRQRDSAQADGSIRVEGQKMLPPQSDAERLKEREKELAAASSS